MEYLYHATIIENKQSIIQNGLKTGCDGFTYLAEDEIDALKFMVFRLQHKNFVVFKVDVSKLNEKLIKESFDHSQEFFKCKVWAYPKKIPKTALIAISEYERNVG